MQKIDFTVALLQGKMITLSNHSLQMLVKVFLTRTGSMSFAGVETIDFEMVHKNIDAMVNGAYWNIKIDEPNPEI